MGFLKWLRGDDRLRRRLKHVENSLDVCEACLAEAAKQIESLQAEVDVLKRQMKLVGVQAIGLTRKLQGLTADQQPGDVEVGVAQQPEAVSVEDFRRRQEQRAQDLELLQEEADEDIEPDDGK